jgi:uncharacterized membrane protein
MILHLPPGSPPLLRDAATLALFLHIGGASVGLVSGAAAMAFRKGGRAHRWAGNVFFVSMLTMAAVGACVAPFLLVPQWSSTGVGIFTFYLVATGWATVKRKEGVVGVFEVGASFAALGAAAAFAGLGWAGAHSPDGTIGGLPWQPAIVFGAVAALGAGCDLRVILRGGVSGIQRIARHLWRMCLGLSIASGSFFLGQQQVFPAPLRGSPILYLLAVAPLGMMIFWLLRVRFTNQFQPMRTSRGSLRGPAGDQRLAEGRA